MFVEIRFCLIIENILYCFRFRIVTEEVERFLMVALYSGIGVVYKKMHSREPCMVFTFIDHNTGIVLNGSRLGKRYAAKRNRR